MTISAQSTSLDTFLKFASQGIQRSCVNLLILGLCAVGFVLPDSTQQLLALVRLEVQQGAWWQLITGHLMHFTTHHLGWNCLGLLTLMVIFNREQQPVEDGIFVLFSALLISAGLYYLQPSPVEYRGLSGLLYGYLIFYAGKAWQHNRYFALAIIIGLAARLLWQYSSQFDADAQIDTLGGRISIEAHLYGFISGGVGIAGLWVCKKFSTRLQHSS